MTNDEAHQFLHAVREITLHHREWVKDYVYLSKKNEFIHRSQVDEPLEDIMMGNWFSL